MLRQPFRNHNRKLGSHGRKAEVADLLGKLVDVPGPVFHDHAPGTLFRCVCVCVCMCVCVCVCVQHLFRQQKCLLKVVCYLRTALLLRN